MSYKIQNHGSQHLSEFGEIAGTMGIASLIIMSIVGLISGDWRPALTILGFLLSIAFVFLATGLLSMILYGIGHVLFDVLEGKKFKQILFILLITSPIQFYLLTTFLDVDCLDDFLILLSNIWTKAVYLKDVIIVFGGAAAVIAIFVKPPKFLKFLMCD